MQRARQHPDVPIAKGVGAALRRAQLRYAMDDAPGIHRKRRGKRFHYIDPRGRPIRDRDEIDRLRRLAIPPAWRDVWICAESNGHLLATGRDARGRKQYRYHPRWRELRDETKYHRMLEFGRALPRIRARIARDLARPGLPREKVVDAYLAGELCAGLASPGRCRDRLRRDEAALLAFLRRRDGRRNWPSSTA